MIAVVSSTKAAELVQRLAACPVCLSPVRRLDGRLRCDQCAATYPNRFGAPVLVAPESELYPALYENDRRGVGAFLISAADPPKKFMERVTEWLRPEDRIWSRKAEATIVRLVSEVPATGVVLNIGAAPERVLKRAFARHGVVKVGFPTHGGVDLYGDALQLPVKSESVDLLVSSSVIEHLPDPERAASEQFRVVKPGGSVYAEIPFIRGFHMIPSDYQRYTVSGIQCLFDRAGFDTVEVGVCSGPFTALALLIQDNLVHLPHLRRLPATIQALLRRMLHPIKYLDRFVEGRNWARICACNFFYVGHKPEVQNGALSNNPPASN